jgi:hypothetical protein
MEVINGGVAVYDKNTGQQLSSQTSLESFFSVTVTNGPYAGTYPTSFAADSRLVYDLASQRWIATTLDQGSQQVLLAVSHGSNPVGGGGGTWVSDNWTKYLVPISQGSTTDFPRLGVDGNGIYITCSLLAPRYTTMLAALPKGPFLNGSAQTVQANFIFDTGVSFLNKIYPAINFDPVGTSDPVWFIGELNGSLFYNQLVWANGLGAQPVFQLNPWGTLQISPSYFDMPLGGGTGSILAPQKGGPHKVNARTGSQLIMAMVRKLGGTQYLWTSHTIGVNNAGNNDGPPADRMASEWFQIQTTPTFQIVGTGRIFDSGSSPRSYYLPSLAVNWNGDMVIGFSVSSANDFIGAFYTRRSGSGAWLGAPIPYSAGQQYCPLPYDITPWGDYSYSSLDPDGLRIWTIQEYAIANDYWGTFVAAVRPFTGGP